MPRAEAVRHQPRWTGISRDIYMKWCSTGEKRDVWQGSFVVLSAGNLPQEITMLKESRTTKRLPLSWLRHIRTREQELTIKYRAVERPHHWQAIRYFCYRSVHVCRHAVCICIKPPTLWWARWEKIMSLGYEHEQIHKSGHLRVIPPKLMHIGQYITILS